MGKHVAATLSKSFALRASREMGWWQERYLGEIIAVLTLRNDRGWEGQRYRRQGGGCYINVLKQVQGVEVKCKGGAFALDGGRGHSSAVRGGQTESWGQKGVSSEI